MHPVALLGYLLGMSQHDNSYIKTHCHGNEVRREDSLGKTGQCRQHSSKPEMRCETYMRMEENHVREQEISFTKNKWY